MPFFFFAGIVLAVADWIAVGRDALTVRWITKPGAMLFLLLWFATSAPAATSPQTLWFTLALCLSLIGDVFLLMEGYQLVKGGLAFMLAHVCFIVAYHIPFQLPAAILLIFLLNLMLTLAFFRRIILAIRAMGDNDLAVGVSIYALALTCMTSTAISTLFRSGWAPIAAWPTAIGGLLFYGSDLLLFYKVFIEPKKALKVLTMLTYHLGQFSLVYGFLWFLFS